MCDLPCPIFPNPLPSSSLFPSKIRITPNSVQDAHDWRILYHLRSTTKTLDPKTTKIPPPKLKIKRRKTFRVLNVIPASTFTSAASQDKATANEVQGATKQQTAGVVQLYSHRHGTVISCNGVLCQTLNWKRKWRICGGLVEIRGYRWQPLQQEEDGNDAPSADMDEKLKATKSPDDRGKAKGKTMKPGTWIPFLVKREKGSEIWCWESRDTTSGHVDAEGAEQEKIAALMEEGRLEFVNEALAEEEKRRILLTAVAITEWERWKGEPGLVEKARQRVLRILCLTA